MGEIGYCCSGSVHVLHRCCAVHSAKTSTSFLPTRSRVPAVHNFDVIFDSKSLPLPDLAFSLFSALPQFESSPKEAMSLERDLLARYAEDDRKRKAKIAELEAYCDRHDEIASTSASSSSRGSPPPTRTTDSSSSSVFFSADVSSDSSAASSGSSSLYPSSVIDSDLGSSIEGEGGSGGGSSGGGRSAESQFSILRDAIRAQSETSSLSSSSTVAAAADPPFTDESKLMCYSQLLSLKYGPKLAVFAVDVCNGDIEECKKYIRVVQDLSGCGFSSEKAKEAVLLHGSDMNACLDYLTGQAQASPQAVASQDPVPAAHFESGTAAFFGGV